MIALAVFVCVWKGNTEPIEIHQDETTQEIADPPARYELTDAERDEVERVVMAEAGSESQLGQMAVAQCILNACERSGLRPTEAVEEYQYRLTASRRPSEPFLTTARLPSTIQFCGFTHRHL